MSTFHIDEYDEQALIESGTWQYEIDYDLVFYNERRETYITVIINGIPEWRRVFISKDRRYINVGTKEIEI